MKKILFINLLVILTLIAGCKSESDAKIVVARRVYVRSKEGIIFCVQNCGPGQAVQIVPLDQISMIPANVIIDED